MCSSSYFLATVVTGSAGFATDRLRIAYSSISGAYAGIWVAHDAGLFAKEGLGDQIISFRAPPNSPNSSSPVTYTSPLLGAAR